MDMTAYPSVREITNLTDAACCSQAAASAISEAYGKAAYDQLGFTVATRAEDFQRALSLAFASVEASSSTNAGDSPPSLSHVLHAEKPGLNEVVHPLTA